MPAHTSLRSPNPDIPEAGSQSCFARIGVSKAFVNCAVWCLPSDQGYSGVNVAEQSQKHGIALFVVKLQEAKRAFGLLPLRWVVERSFAWASRFRRVVKVNERLPDTVAGMHVLAFVCIMLKQCFSLFQLMQCP